jgi:hypothetical protein
MDIFPSHQIAIILTLLWSRHGVISWVIYKDGCTFMAVAFGVAEFISRNMAYG